MHCSYVVVFWDAALHNATQMKPMVVKSLENSLDLTA